MVKVEEREDGKMIDAKTITRSCVCKDIYGTSKSKEFIEQKKERNWKM